jgi:nicotinate phosphoribosyltransferase
MAQNNDHPIHLALSEGRADIYFARTQTVLEKEGLNPVVTMEIFPSRDGLICGMREVLDLLSTVLPPKTEVWALNEGESMEAKEIVLRITAPYQSFGLYETAILGILAHESGWATAGRECVEATEGIPVVGGCVGCATPAGAALADLSPSGTIPHAMILIFGDTVEATLAFDRHMPPEVNRIALVDTFKDEAEESLRVAAALGERLWGVRLDTPAERGRVTPDLVKEVRARLDQAGYQHVKIVVSGGIDPPRIRLFRERGAPIDAFGIGSAISGAPPIDFTGDIKAIEGKPIAKRGRIPGITLNPRLKKVALI